MRLPSQWHEPPSETSQPQASGENLARWWENFDDPLLDRLIEQALASNLDLKSTEARVRESRAVLVMTASNLYPTLDNSWSFTRQRYSENTPFGSFPQVFPPEYNLFDGGFDSIWEIDLFGGIRRSVEAARAESQASVDDLRDIRITVLAEVARDYATIRSLQQRILIARAAVRDQAASLELTRARFQMGFAAELPVSQARSLLLATQTNIPELEAELAQGIHALSVLLAKEPNALGNELWQTKPVPGSANPDAIAMRIPVGLPSDLLRRRPDIRAAERRLAAATARVGVATAELFPSFSLTGIIGFQSLGPTDFLEGASRFWSVGPALTLPIFEGGRLRANLKAQNAREEQAFYAYKKTVLAALREVEDALTGYAEDRRRHDLLVADVAEYQRSENLARDRYVHGFGSYLDVLDAQRSLYAEEDQLEQSNQRVVLDLVATYKALGGGWQPSGYGL